MDVSPVQSSAKCGSDFSIERILSSDAGSGRSSSAEPPSWLCCTRYQPPRLPRSASSACRSRRSGRHARVPFTAAQAAALEAAYARAPYLAPPALRALAAALQLRDDRIKIWFQNRRARERREKMTAITPPREMALPATSLFNHQGALPTAGDAWASHKTSDINTFPNATVTLSPSHIEYRPLSENTNDFPQDLTVTSSPSVCCSPTNESLEPPRPDTPLDVETIVD
ncbi:homeobox protein MSX-1-like [Ostrinia furnacalis]|uniref:homeobox protein MSX-1-like n=1 Tax=Ostrinia furnacalis TaxID=93504 RepID=UPI001039C838|nr:homeobox protein MSX-1-like [Ostrinia furnacalis]